MVDPTIHPCVLVMGNGPSSWWIGKDEATALRTALRARIIACNLVAAEIEADFGVAVDDSVYGDLVRAVESRHLSTVALGSQRAMARHKSASARTIQLSESYCGYSSGVAAFHLALELAPESIYLCGFDGEQDRRTRHQGTPRYRSCPTRASAFRRWSGRMLEISRDSSHESYRLTSDADEAHPLWSLPATPVDLHAAVASFRSGVKNG